MPLCYGDFKPDCDSSRLPYVLQREILIVGCSRRASGLGNFGSSTSISWHVGCRYLEQLSLEWISVSGHSFKLKYLCIRWCEYLQYVDIYDTNLVSFTYKGMEDHIRWCLVKVPQLSEVSIEGFMSERVGRELKRVVGPPHRYLKVAGFHNYYGRSSDLETVKYFIDNAIALEKLVGNPCEEECITGGVKKVKEPGECALQQLKGKLPSRIELVINYSIIHAASTNGWL